MICYYIRTKIVVIIREVFEEHKVINELYIFRRIRVVCCHDKNLINCYLFVVALIVIAIIFAIFILIVVSIVVSISLYVVLFVFCFLILIVKVLALIICEKICRRYNCESYEKFQYLKLCRRLLY